MKAKIISIEFERKKNDTKCIITFNDPYCGNVKRIVTGVAKCNPDDKFDKTLGRRIAEGRAKRAMFQKLNKSAHNTACKMQEQSIIQWERARRETKHIQELLNKHYDEQQN